MKWIKYSKYTGEDMGIGAEDLLQALADFLLQSGFNTQYMPMSEWNQHTLEDLKNAIINDLGRQLQQEVEARGPHWRSRARNLRWAVQIVQRQMAVPWEWQSMPEVAAEIPGLEAGLRGGVADQLKRIIDQARRKALGEATLGFPRPAAFRRENFIL